MARWVLLVVVAIVLIVGLMVGLEVWLIVDSEPRTAADLEIGGLTQYGLACAVYKNAVQVEDLYLTKPHEAKRLAKRNAYMAGFLNANLAGREVKQIARDQYLAVCGPQVRTNGFATKLEACGKRLMPQGINLPRLAEESTNEATRSTYSFRDESQDDCLARVIGVGERNEELRQKIVENRRLAEIKVAEGEKIARLTGDKVPLLAAKVVRDRYQFYFDLMVAVRIGGGLPWPDLETRRKEVGKLYGQMNGLYQHTYRDLLNPEEEVRPLPE